MLRAMSTSSVWRRGFLLPMYLVFKVWMGSMADGAMRCTLCGMSPRTLIAFNRRAAEAPNRLLVLPVTMVPSSNSMAAAGPPDTLARSRQGAMTGRMVESIFALFIRRLIL